jgi:uncharacterized integral membrane protein
VTRADDRRDDDHGGEGLAGQRATAGDGSREGEPAGDDRRPRGTEGRTDTQEPSTTRPKVPTAVRATQVSVLLVAALFGVFAVANSHRVDFSWLVGETQVRRDAAGQVVSGGVPLIVLLLVSFILGAVLGGAWVGQVVRRRRRVMEDRDRSGG